MFPEEMVRPFREELTNIGFRELRTPAQVDAILKNEKGTVLVVVNSVCGCAAGKARPAIAEKLANTYGLQSYAQVDAIRYTWSATFPGVNVSRTWTWDRHRC